MRPALATRLKKLLLAAALLAGLYLAGANLFLNTPLGPWVVNRRPQTVRVTWHSAWTLLPGSVSVRGLRIDGHTGRVDWWITAERGQGWVDLPALFVRRFQVRGFTAEGVRSATVRRAEESRRTRRLSPHPWRIEMHGMSLAAVREIGWNGFRLEGDGTARGGFSLLVGGDFSLDATKLWMPGSRLVFEEDPVSSGLDVQAEVAIAPYTPRQHPGVEGWDFISGILRTRGTTVPSKLADGGTPGALVVDLRLEQGRLTPGSRATLRAGTPGVNPLSALLSVEPHQLVLRADARGLTAGRRADPSLPPSLTADTAHLEAVTPEIRFSRLLAEGQKLRHNGSLSADGVLRATFNATGLRLAGSGPRLTWRCAADRAAGQIDLSALLRHQIVLDDLQGDGVSATAERTRTPQPTPPLPSAWTVRLDGGRLTGVREAVFEDLRLDGVQEVSGGLALDPDGTFSLEGLALRVSGGSVVRRLVRGDDVLVRDLSLATDLRLGPYSPRTQTGLAALDALSGSVAARGTLLSLPFLDASRRSRPGDLTVDLRLEHGRLIPGARLTVTAGKTLDLGATVDATRPPRLSLSGEVKGFVLGGGTDYPPLLRAGTATLRTTTPELRLRRLLATAQELKEGRPAAGEPFIGNLEIEGMQANGIGERIVWQLAADRGSAHLDLPALRERRVVFTGLHLQGAVAQIGPATGPPPVVPPDKRWAVEIKDGRIDDLRSIAAPTGRLLGPGSSLEGDLTFDRQRLLTVSRALLTVPEARIESRRETVAREVTVRAEVHLAPFEPGKLYGLPLLRVVTGAVTLQGQVSSLGFLDRYLERMPGLEVDGQGRLDADVRLEAGRLLPGSRIGLRGGTMRASFLDSMAHGEAAVTGTVVASPHPAATLRVDFPAFDIAPGPLELDPDIQPSAYMRGAGLRLAITSNDLDLATPVSDLHAAIDLPDGQIPDLAAYNLYLPSGTGVSLVSGTGRLRLHLDVDASNAATKTAEGEVLLSSETARVRFQDVELAGHLLLRAQLASRDLAAKSFEIAGTRLDFDRVTYRETGAGPGAESPDWWAHLRMTGGTMTWSRPLTLQGEAVMEMKDSGFLLSVFARKKNFLHWFHRLLSIQGVRAVGTLRCGGGAIEIAPLRVTGGRFDLRSRLRFTKQSKQGDLFLRWGKLAAGIELRDGKRTFKLRHPEAWFESGKEPE